MWSMLGLKDIFENICIMSIVEIGSGQVLTNFFPLHHRKSNFIKRTIYTMKENNFKITEIVTLYGQLLTILREMFIVHI